MSVETFECNRCGAKIGMTGPGSGSDDDLSTEDYYDSEVEFHRSGECAPLDKVPAETEPDPRVVGLRLLADALESDPRLDSNIGASAYPFSIRFWAGDRDDVSRTLAAFTEVTGEGVDGDYYRVHGRIGGLYVHVAARASDIGGREVTREQTVFEVEPFLTGVSS